MADHQSYLDETSTNVFENERMQPIESIPTINTPNRPRSCAICRKRKVKCDKKQPCCNCIKSRLECTFLPPVQRAKGSSRKPQQMKVTQRLRRLENILQNLNSVQSPLSHVGTTPKETRLNVPFEEDIISLESRVGRLVVGDGKSRYFTPSFWASLSNEVEDIRGILEESDSDDIEGNPGKYSSSAAHRGFIFGLRSINHSIYVLHPPPKYVELYWKIYKNNFDPLVKIIHIPSEETTILETANNLKTSPDQINRWHEALMFAIYYAVATSTPPHECKTIFGEERNDLISRYRFGVEQALARADFLQSDKIIVIQTFLIFLTCLRQNENVSVIWTYTGLVVRMAQRLGLHRDGSHYPNLKPFQIEMRRRIWWQAVLLDALTSEDYGCDPTLIESITDTQLPRNINDSDFGPDTLEIPDSKTGCTEMTFGLIRFEISACLRKIQYVPPSIPGGKIRVMLHGHHGIETKKEMIHNLQQRIESHYIRDSDLSVPIYWVIATASRLILSKMLLMLYHAYQRKDGGITLPGDVRDSLFETAIQTIEYAHLLDDEERALQFRWFFRTYIQWHAVAFLLSELCNRTAGPEVELAWHTIEKTMSRKLADEIFDSNIKKKLWDPLGRLMAKAKAGREKNEEGTTLGVIPIVDDDTMSSGFGLDDAHSTQFLGDFSLGTIQTTGLEFPTLKYSSSLVQPFLFGTSRTDFTCSGSSEISPRQQLGEPVDESFNMQHSGTMMNYNSPGTLDNINSTKGSTSFLVSNTHQTSWTNWDDMVQEFGLHSEQGPNCQRTPSIFGSGSNFY